MRVMNAIMDIRKNRFGVSQAAFAVVAGVSQATVSRWENGELEPKRRELARIRAAATTLGIEWSDAWFFDAQEAAE